MILKISIPTDKGALVHYVSLLAGNTWEITDEHEKKVQISVLTEGQAIQAIKSRP